MSEELNSSKLSRRTLLGTVGKAAVTSAISGPLLQTAILSGVETPNSVAGVDRVVVLPGKTYLRGWAGMASSRPGHRRLHRLRSFLRRQ